MASEFFNWTFAGAPVSVDLDLGLLERLKHNVLRSGDRERSGVLLGSTTVDSPIRVRVTGFLPAPKKKLRATLRGCRGGPASPVGYYRFRDDDRICLDEHDLTVAASSFKDPGAVFLVGRVEAPGEAAAGLFFWDEGQIHADFSFLEFPLSADALREPAVAAAPGRNPRWALAGVGVLSFLTLTALIAPWRSPPPAQAVREPLGLHYEARGVLVRVGWDKSLARIAAARSGALSIREDGSETTVPLAGDQLRSGALLYVRKSAGESIRFRLEVRDPASRRTAEDLTARFPPNNSIAATRPHRTAEPRRIEPLPAETQSPPPKRFQPPSRRGIAGKAYADLPELPAVSLAAAGPVTLALPAALTPPNPTPPAVRPAPSKEVMYVPPKPVSVVRPALPATVAAMVHGKTRIQVKVGIDRNGNVVAAEPVALDPRYRILGTIVTTAARYWRFEPARRDGVPTPGDLVVNVDFEPGGK